MFFFNFAIKFAFLVSNQLGVNPLFFATHSIIFLRVTSLWTAKTRLFKLGFRGVLGYFSYIQTFIKVTHLRFTWGYDEVGSQKHKNHQFWTILNIETWRMKVKDNYWNVFFSGSCIAQKIQNKTSWAYREVKPLIKSRKWSISQHWKKI